MLYMSAATLPQKPSSFLAAFHLSLRSHPVDLVQSRLQYIVEHPQDGRRHYKKQELPSVVAPRGLGDRRQLGRRRILGPEPVSDEPAQPQPDDHPLGAPHPVDLVQRRLEDVEEDPGDGRDDGQQQREPAVVALGQLGDLLGREGRVGVAERGEDGPGDGGGGQGMGGLGGGGGGGGEEARGEVEEGGLEGRLRGVELGLRGGAGGQALGVEHGHGGDRRRHRWRLSFEL